MTIDYIISLLRIKWHNFCGHKSRALIIFHPRLSNVFLISTTTVLEVGVMLLLA